MLNHSTYPLIIVFLLISSFNTSIIPRPPKKIGSQLQRPENSSPSDNINTTADLPFQPKIQSSQLQMFFSCCFKDTMQKDQYDVIVIGSGIAGMAAAHELAENGKSVLVLQANSYIGGRMKATPVTLSDNSVFQFEEGANWIHGKSKKNPLTELASKIPNVKLLQTDDQNTAVYDQNGKAVDKEVEREWDEYEEVIEKVQKQEKMSVYDAIKKINPSKLNNKFFMFNVAIDVEFETSSNIRELSAEYGQDDESFKGEDFLVMTRYQAFAQHLAKHQNITVLLNHSVTGVTANGQNYSTIQCSNGKAFHSKKVVIAVPLGVLKKNGIKFSPELPGWKDEAIDKLKMGNVCKILIIPKKNFNITDKEQYISVIANDVNKRGAATLFLNLPSLAKIPAYMTFGLGQNSDQIQQMPEAQLKQLIAKRLDAITDGVSPNDFDIVRSGWRGNQNFGGAYTYSAVNTYPKHWENMAKPVFSSGWYFCGEHTNSKYRGTVHGGYLSGIHTAAYIQDNVSEQKWRYADKS